MGPIHVLRSSAMIRRIFVARSGVAARLRGGGVDLGGQGAGGRRCDDCGGGAQQSGVAVGSGVGDGGGVGTGVG